MQIDEMLTPNRAKESACNKFIGLHMKVFEFTKGRKIRFNFEKKN